MMGDLECAVCGASDRTGLVRRGSSWYCMPCYRGRVQMEDEA